MSDAPETTDTIEPTDTVEPGEPQAAGEDKATHEPEKAEESETHEGEPHAEPHTEEGHEVHEEGDEDHAEGHEAHEEGHEVHEEKHEEHAEPSPAVTPAPKGGKGKKEKGGKGKKGKKKKKEKVEEPKGEETEAEQTASLGSSTLTLDLESEFKKILHKGKMPLSASSSTVKYTHSVSVHSEDSSSSKEDTKKGSAESLDDGFDFEGNHKFCLAAMGENPDISVDLRVSIETLLFKYQKAMERNKKGKEKAEADLVNTTEKMMNDLQRANELQEEVNDLKKKLDNSEKYVSDLKKELDESYEREHNLLDESKLLQKKIEYLDSEQEKRQLEDHLRDQGLDITAKSRETFTKEITRLKQDLELSESRLQLSLEDLEELLKKYKEKEAECSEMEELMKGSKYDVLREMQKTKMLETDLLRITEDMRNLKVTVAKHYKTFKNASQELMKKDEEVFELRKNNRQINQQNESMVKLVTELKERLECGTDKYFILEEEHKKLKATCVVQTSSLKVIRKQSEDVNKAQDRWLGRVISADRKRAKAVQEAKRLFNQLKDMSHESKKNRLTMIKLNKTISNFKKDNNRLSKQIKNLQGVVDQQQKQADEQYQVLSQMTEESNKLKSENELQKKALTKFFRIKEKDMKEKMILEEIRSKIENNLRECSIEKLALTKELGEDKRRLKELEKLYHDSATENKYLNKRLIETKGQVKDVQNKSQIIFQEMELVKDQLLKKQQDYEKLHTSNRKDVFTKDTMTIKLDSCLENRKSLLKTIEDKDIEIKQQVDIIVKKETRIKELQLETETLKRQTGDLKCVIQKRSAELSLVYEKTDLMKYILDNGEEQYQQRLKDIELLKREIRKLRADKMVLVNLSENTPNLRLEMFHLHKDLSKERQRCRALEEQMENPLNIHRWRLLEGKDPEKRDLIEKNQILQKKLIRVEEDNGIIREQCACMEMLYLNMRTYLNNLPGKDAGENLELARRCLRDKTKENRALSAELAAYENELAHLKKKMEEAKSESNEMKEKYYEMKKKYEEEKNGKKKCQNQEIKTNGPRIKPFPGGFGLKYIQQMAM